MHLSLKMLSGMANSEDLDQTALFAYDILSETLVFEILGHLLHHSANIFYTYMYNVCSSFSLRGLDFT